MEYSTKLALARLQITSKTRRVKVLPNVPTEDKVILGELVYWNINGKWEAGKTLDEMARELILISKI